MVVAAYPGDGSTTHHRKKNPCIPAGHGRAPTSTTPTQNQQAAERLQHHPYTSQVTAATPPRPLSDSSSTPRPPSDGSGTTQPSSDGGRARLEHLARHFALHQQPPKLNLLRVVLRLAHGFGPRRGRYAGSIPLQAVPQSLNKANGPVCCCAVHNHGAHPSARHTSGVDVSKHRKARLVGLARHSPHNIPAKHNLHSEVPVGLGGGWVVLCPVDNEQSHVGEGPVVNARDEIPLLEGSDAGRRAPRDLCGRVLVL
mmetsp:Transcript_16230/g.40915  ORF Transcript_16230/g.40915 Transcript_16230/m.40915 type:complete len:255 (-) Transcript_16230:231-995(-)